MQELWPKIFQQVGFGSPFENQRQTSKMFPMLFKSCTNIGLTKHKKTAHDNDCEPLDTPSTPNPQNAIENLQKSESKGQLISEWLFVVTNFPKNQQI